MNKRMLGFLSTGHLVNDLHQGALPALLPFLILQHDLTYTAAAGVVFTFTGTATITQPFFGMVADRIEKAWLIPAGIMLTSIGFALIGFVSSYQSLIMAVILSGIGSAAFHPEAARIVNRAGDDSKASAMSIFGVGGTVGFSIGPGLITSAVLFMGLQGTMITLLPAGLLALLFLYNASAIAAYQQPLEPKSSDIQCKVRDDWRSFTLLSLTIIGKSIIYYALFTFIPLYWKNILNQSQMAGGMALTLFSVAGVFGNLLGGRLADRYGHTKIITIGCLLLIPSIPAFLWADTVYTATPILFLVGTFLLMTYGPAIVMGQNYLPNHVGFSSGMTLGVAFSVGGMVVPFLGHLADNYDLATALMPIAVIPIIITIISCMLPSGDWK